MANKLSTILFISPIAFAPQRSGNQIRNFQLIKTLESMRHVIRFTFKEFFAQLVPSLYCAALMTAVIFAGKAALSGYGLFMAYQIIQLITLGLFGSIVYLAASLLINKSSTLEIKEMMLGLDKK